MNRFLRCAAFSVILMLIVPVCAHAEAFVIDPDYTMIMFRIRHLNGFNTGIIREFEGTIEVDKKGALKKITGTADVNSIDTRNKERDEDLKSERFFDAVNHPELKLDSRKVKKGQIQADITIKGVKKSVTFDYEMLGFAIDQFGRHKVALAMKGSINRQDFGVSFNMETATGGMLLGDNVDIRIEAQGILEEDAKIPRKSF